MTRVNGLAAVGDRVIYQDQANAPRTFRVVEFSTTGDQYKLVAVDGSSLAPEWSDLRQAGWTFEDDTEAYGADEMTADALVDKVADFLDDVSDADLVEIYGADFAQILAAVKRQAAR